MVNLKMKINVCSQKVVIFVIYGEKLFFFIALFGINCWNSKC